MKGAVRLLRFSGITLYLHVTWLLPVAWLLVIFVQTGMHNQQVLWSVLFLLALLASIMLHEFGHALAAARFGIKARDITLYPVGGIASIEKLPDNPRQELWISAAGPAANLLLAAYCWIFSAQRDFGDAYVHFTGIINATNFLSLLGLANLVLAGFNLLPAFPLDGGRLLRALFAFRFNYIKATSIVAFVSKMIAALFIIYGVGTLNLLLVLPGLFILFVAQAEEAYLQLRKLVDGYRLNEMLMYDYNSIAAGLTVQEAIAVLENNHSKFFILIDKGQPVGTLDRMAVIKALADQQYGVPIVSLMKENLKPMEGNTNVADVLEQLAANEETLYPVMERGRFIGVVSFRQVIEYIFLHSAHTKDFAKTKSLVELV